ncbi:MAG: hypothetical protein AAGD10_03580 [Myxococcota bacterium]
MDTRILLPLALLLPASCSSTQVHRNADPTTPHAEVHFRMLHMEHATTELRNVAWVNGRKVTRQFEYPGAPFETTFVRVPPGGHHELRVGSRYMLETSEEEQIRAMLRILDQAKDVRKPGQSLAAAIHANPEIRTELNRRFPDREPDSLWEALLLLQPHYVDECIATTDLFPEPGGRYLIEYRYLGWGRCQVRCRRVYDDINRPNPQKTSFCDGSDPNPHTPPTVSPAPSVRHVEQGLPRKTVRELLLTHAEVSFDTAVVLVVDAYTTHLEAGDELVQIGWMDRSRWAGEMDAFEIASSPGPELPVGVRLVIRVIRQGQEQVVSLR